MDPLALNAEGAALLRAAQFAPGDDSARLVFADWLDENDNPTAATRLRFWVEVRTQVRQTLADVEAVIERAVGHAPQWRVWAEVSEGQIRTDWVSELCAVEVERLVLAEPGVPDMIFRGLEERRASISERADPGRRYPPLCVEVEWVAIGCVPRPAPDPYPAPENRFPFAFPDTTRGIDLVRALSDIINSGSETAEIAAAARRSLWRTAEVVFFEAHRAENAVAPQKKRKRKK